MVIVEDEDYAVGKILFEVNLVRIAVVFDFLNTFSPPFVVGIFVANGGYIVVGHRGFLFVHSTIEELGDEIEIVTRAIVDDMVFKIFHGNGKIVFAQFFQTFFIIFFHGVMFLDLVYF